MRDIFVHLRMKLCCRSILKELDTHKKKAKHKGGVLGVKSLFELLSEKTIDDAKAAIPESEQETEGEIEVVTRAVCEKICTKHAEEHETKGELAEGGFWHDLEGAIRWKLAGPK